MIGQHFAPFALEKRDLAFIIFETVRCIFHHDQDYFGNLCDSPWMPPHFMHLGFMAMYVFRWMVVPNRESKVFLLVFSGTLDPVESDINFTFATHASISNSILSDRKVPPMANPKLIFPHRTDDMLRHTDQSSH